MASISIWPLGGMLRATMHFKIALIVQALLCGGVWFSSVSITAFSSPEWCEALHEL